MGKLTLTRTPVDLTVVKYDQGSAGIVTHAMTKARFDCMRIDVTVSVERKLPRTGWKWISSRKTYIILQLMRVR